MKKIFGFLLCALLISVRVYAEDDIPTDKIYKFDRANVASVLAEFIEDEKKAEKAADKYNELSNNSENAISAVDFVDVCVAGGMNMKLADGSGYMKCLDMFMKLIEMQNLDTGGFDMYCPATGNALKSITDKTQVGDVCGGTPDTYIEYGHVTLKSVGTNNQHKYVCTCTPQSCKDGYYWNTEKYQCSVKDKEGYCVRHILGSFEYKNGKLPTDSGIGISDWDKRNNAYYNDKYAQINASTDAFNRCVEYGANQGCRIRGALASADVGSGFGSAKKYQVICNPENYEIVADKKVQEDKEKKHKVELEQNTSYYEVCGKDKGKGECIDNVFSRKVIGGTQVSYANGNALVKEYARVRLGDEITCGGDNYDKNIRKSGTDYFIKCKSLKDLTKYYEFKFDDLEESKDLTANTSVYNAVWHIIYNYNIAKNSYNGYDTKNKANCDAVGKTFEKVCNGCGTEWRESGYVETRGKKFCYDVINIADNTTCKKSPNDLSTAFDIDPFVFCKNTHNQLKNTGSLESLLKQYLSDKSGVATYNIECYPQTLCYTGSGCEGIIGHGDDIKTCVVHGNKDYTVDFVFDDINEFSKKLSEVSIDAMQCVIGGHELSVKLGVELNAKNKDKKCTGLTKELCADLDKMIKKHGGSGAHYDKKKMACIINSAKEYSTQDFWTNMGISAVVAVGSAVMVIGSGGIATPLVVGGVTMVIETGINGAFYIVEELEDGQAGRYFRKFIDAAKKCKDSKCAQKVIKNHYNDLAMVKEDFNYEDAEELQKELDRLFDLMEGDFCWQDQDGNILNPDSNGKCDKLIVTVYLDDENKTLQYAEMALIIGGATFNPETVIMKLLARSKKLTRFLERIGKLDDLIKNAKNIGYTGKLKGWKISELEMVKSNSSVSVFKFLELNSGKVYYLKYTDNMQEITRTKHAYEILNGRSDIVHIVKIVEDDQTVLRDFALKNGISQSVGKYWFLMEETPSSHIWSQIINGLFDSVLGGKKITVAEQEEILDAVDLLNADGVYHGDIMSNMFFMRESNGKLRVDIIDFEPWSAKDAPHDIRDVTDIFVNFASRGIAEYTNNIRRSLAEKEFPRFVGMITECRAGVKCPWARLDDLTDIEWAEINKYLKEKYGVELVDDVFADGTPGKRMQKIGEKVDKNIEYINSLKQRVSSGFDRQLNEVASGNKWYLFDKRRLTDFEWAELNKELNKQGVELVDDVFDDGTPGKRMQKIGTKVDRDVEHINSLKQRVSSNFDKHLDEVINENKWYLFDKRRLTDSEWAELNKYLKEKYEVELVDDVYYDGTPGKKMQKIGSKVNDGVNLLTQEERNFVISRLNDITGTEWEYMGSPGNYGVFVMKTRYISMNVDRQIAVTSPLVDAEVEYELFDNGWLFIREENIDNIGKIKPKSVVIEEASKSGSEFLGKLKGWKIENIEKVTESFRNTVFKFTESSSGKVYYLKRVPDMTEINRTKRAYEILDGNSDIVHTVKIVEEDQDVLVDFAVKNNLLDSSGKYWLLTEEVPSSKTATDLVMEDDALNKVLRGKPITVKEQKEITKAVDRLNSGGIVHTDLEHNMFFMREPNGDLRVDIIDYEYIPGFDFADSDKNWLKRTFDYLTSKGLASAK